MPAVRARKSISVTNEVGVELYHQAQYNQCVTLIDLRALSWKNRSFLASTEKMGRSEGSGTPAERILRKCTTSSGLCLDGDPIQ